MDVIPARAKAKKMLTTRAPAATALSGPDRTASAAPVRPVQPAPETVAPQKPAAPAPGAEQPLPPKPPGEAFAIAVITGQLPPRPTTAQQLQLRLAGASLPEEESFSATSRLA